MASSQASVNFAAALKKKYFFEPGNSTGMRLYLRRTLVLKESYELLAASFELLYLLTARGSRLAT